MHVAGTRVIYFNWEWSFSKSELGPPCISCGRQTLQEQMTGLSYHIRRTGMLIPDIPGLTLRLPCHSGSALFAG